MHHNVCVLPESHQLLWLTVSYINCLSRLEPRAYEGKEHTTYVVIPKKSRFGISKLPLCVAVHTPSTLTTDAWDLQITGSLASQLKTARWKFWKFVNNLWSHYAQGFYCSIYSISSNKSSKRNLSNHSLK